MAANALYKLECITDNPLYEGFGFVREESLRNKGRLAFDFDPDDVKTRGRAWTVTRMASLWKPQAVGGRVLPSNDYPCVNLTIPAFSRRAVDALRDLLEPNGELLPLVSSVGEYYVYNVTTVADILDHRRSKVDWADEKHVTAIEINRYECAAEKMTELSIFRIVEMPASTYVTQPFVEQVNQTRLEGFHFIKLWPLPDGVDWRDDDRRKRKQEQQIESKRGRVPVNANTVVVMLSTAKSKPNKQETERVEKIMDEIDSLLYNPTAKQDASHYGSLEGHEHTKGEFRLFLSCPNADTLVERLRPWLAKLTWKEPVRVLKRYGEYVDLNCREELVEL